MFERESGLDYWVDAITGRGPMIMRDDVVGICKFAGLSDDQVAQAVTSLTGLAIDGETIRKTVMRTFLRGYKLERQQGFTQGDYGMPAEVHIEHAPIQLPHFNTPEFFAELQGKVCARFDALLEAEGV